MVVNLSEAEVIPCGDGDNDGSGYGGATVLPVIWLQ